MVAGTGIEPACVAYETTEEPLLNPASIWSGRRDFNPRSPVPETGALSPRPLPVKLVGMRGFEPPPPCPQSRWASSYPTSRNSGAACGNRIRFFGLEGRGTPHIPTPRGAVSGNRTRSILVGDEAFCH
jgi:hypothetical protein